MKKAITLMALTAGLSFGGQITGWVAAVTPAGYTAPYYTVPDADYDHFIATVILPLVNFDEYWARLGLFNQETYWQLFDCGCTSYPAVISTQLPASVTPEPASWWLICAAALAFLVAAAGNAWFDRTEVRRHLKAKSEGDRQ